MSIDKIKVLIADDHQIMLEGLRLLIEQEDGIAIVGEASNGNEVLEMVERAEELDIVILDINMPEKDGIEVTKELKEQHPEVKILIVSMYNKKEFVKNLMDAGIDGYVLKNAGKKEFMHAIRSLAKGEPYYTAEITQTIAKSYQKNKIFDNPHAIDLTEREKDIIRLIASELSTPEIAEKLFISTHTVSTHRKNILGKLDVKNAAGITRYALQTGIIKGFDI